MLRIQLLFVLVNSALVASKAQANPCYERVDMTTMPDATATWYDIGHRDLGDGIVFSEHSAWDTHRNISSSSFKLSFCEAGRRIRVLYYRRCFIDFARNCRFVGLEGEGFSVADPDPIRTAMIEMVTSDEVYDWNAFRSRLERLGAYVIDPETSGYESCGCAVFYPEMVGDRWPHRVRESEDYAR